MLYTISVVTFILFHCTVYSMWPSCICVQGSLSLSNRLFFSGCFTVCLYVYLLSCLSACLSVCRSVCLSVCLFVCVSICLYNPLVWLNEEQLPLAPHYRLQLCGDVRDLMYFCFLILCDHMRVVWDDLWCLLYFNNSTTIPHAGSSK